MYLNTVSNAPLSDFLAQPFLNTSGRTAIQDFAGTEKYQNKTNFKMSNFCIFYSNVFAFEFDFSSLVSGFNLRKLIKYWINIP